VLLDSSSSPGSWSGRVRVEPSHPALQGHFDGDPILPGVSQIGLALAVASAAGGPALAVTEVRSLRLRRTVRPGDELSLQVDGPDSGGALRFEARCGGGVACRGTLSVRRLHGAGA
jgi:3-hydroxyacyl-[acyl-carrier-protein] dehydratase